MVARMTPVQKVACSNHVWVKFPFQKDFVTAYGYYNCGRIHCYFLPYEMVQ